MPVYRHSVFRQYKGHVRRHQPVKQEQIKRFPLPKWARWYELPEGQIEFPVYGMSGAVSMQCMLLLIDTRKPCLSDGVEVPQGLTDGPNGRWFRIDFPGWLPWRKLIPMIKHALAAMDARA